MICRKWKAKVAGLKVLEEGVHFHIKVSHYLILQVPTKCIVYDWNVAPFNTLAVSVKTICKLSRICVIFMNFAKEYYNTLQYCNPFCWFCPCGNIDVERKLYWEFYWNVISKINISVSMFFLVYFWQWQKCICQVMILLRLDI